MKKTLLFILASLMVIGIAYADASTDRTDYYNNGTHYFTDSMVGDDDTALDGTTITEGATTLSKGWSGGLYEAVNDFEYTTGNVYDGSFAYSHTFGTRSSMRAFPNANTDITCEWYAYYGHLDTQNNYGVQIRDSTNDWNMQYIWDGSNTVQFRSSGSGFSNCAGNPSVFDWGGFWFPQRFEYTAANDSIRFYWNDTFCYSSTDLVDIYSVEIVSGYNLGSSNNATYDNFRCWEGTNEDEPQEAGATPTPTTTTSETSGAGARAYAAAAATSTGRAGAEATFVDGGGSKARTGAVSASLSIDDVNPYVVIIIILVALYIMNKKGGKKK